MATIIDFPASRVRRRSIPTPMTMLAPSFTCTAGDRVFDAISNKNGTVEAVFSAGDIRVRIDGGIAVRRTVSELYPPKTPTPA